MLPLLKNFIIYNLGYTDSHKHAEFFDGMSPIS